MKFTRITSVLVLLVVSFVLVFAAGWRLLSMIVAASPAFAQTLENLTPKVLQTQTAVVVFENPLVDEQGLSVKEVNDNKEKLLGQHITVKGAFDRVDKPWGFWLRETSQDRSEIFIVTNDQIANTDVAEFVLAGQKYLRVSGTLKQMIWTYEDSTDERIVKDGSNANNSRWVIVADQINSISTGAE